MQKLISKNSLYRKTRSCRRITAIALILTVLFTFAPAASAASSVGGTAAAEGAPQVVDIVTCRYCDGCLVALLSDGTVRTAGLEEYLGEELNAWVDSWTDIVQICTMGCEIFGLKEDGTVVSTVGRGEKEWNPHPEPQFDPNTWTGVKELVSSGDFEYYGLTNDGRILVSNDDPIAGFGGGGPFMSWTNIQKVCFFAYGEDRGLFGLRNDGSVIAADVSVLSHYPFPEDLHDVTAIDSSGYVFCALQRDGTIRVAGIVGEFIAEEASRMHDVVQAEVCYQKVVCRLRDGTVKACGGTYPGMESWQDIVDIQDLNIGMGCAVVGLGKDGRVRLASRYTEEPRLLARLRQETDTWENIVRMRVINAQDPYILGWQSDGTMLAAGIDLSGLELPFINWTLSGDTLTISGKGAMPDYSTTTPPWEEHKKEIKQIVIEPGITHIGTQSFQYCSNVEFVSLPDTVTSIGKAAFFKCESLPEIELPAGLRFLGGQVFDHCLSLESAVIPEGVSRLNDAIFNCCENLISVTIPVSVTEIGNSAFNGCGKLRDVYYNGRPRDWKEIEIAPYNKMLLNAGVYSQNCVGETFLYGTYEQDNELVNDKEPIEWVILERDGKRLLAISKYVLDCQPFDMGNTPVTWESCSLRKWLNETFLDAAFSAEEQERLQTVILSEDGDRPYTSQDRVFLLSADEGDQYFASANERICRTTESCLASFQANHIVVNANGVVFWWLRTPGIDSDCERIVFEDGSMPNLVTSGLPGGVRPAVWLDQVPDAVLREASAASG